MLALESHLCLAYRAARMAFYLDTRDLTKFVAFEEAGEALATFICEDGGRPAEDWTNFVQFEVDSWGEIQEMPLMFNRFTHWALCGADAVAPAFGRVA